jgi:hypothetical protein
MCPSILWALFVIRRICKSKRSSESKVILMDALLSLSYREISEFIIIGKYAKKKLKNPKNSNFSVVSYRKLQL